MVRSAADCHLACEPDRIKGHCCLCYCSSYCYQSMCWCVRVCACAGHVLLNVRVSLRVVSLVLIKAEGFTASNTLSWRGTSDILFTSLPL